MIKTEHLKLPLKAVADRIICSHMKCLATEKHP